MLKSFVRVLFFAAIAIVPFSLCAPGPDSAKSEFGPGIEGVSYAEMSQWQSRYGSGGFGGCDVPPPPYCGPAYSHPMAGQKPPSPCRVPKSKKGRSRK